MGDVRTPIEREAKPRRSRPVPRGREHVAYCETTAIAKEIEIDHGNYGNPYYEKPGQGIHASGRSGGDGMTARRATPQAEPGAPTLFELPAPVIQGSAIFAAGETIRYEIRRSWVPKPRRMVAWLMTNPSVAGGEKNDPTAMRVTAFCQSWGYDGWIGVNPVPYVSPTMPEMWKWFDWENNGPDYLARDHLDANLAHIERVGREAALRIVAFGAAMPVRCPEWLEMCVEAFGQPSDLDGSTVLHCIGRSQDGHPKHPLARGKHRVPEGAQPIVWRE